MPTNLTDFIHWPIYILNEKEKAPSAVFVKCHNPYRKCIFQYLQSMFWSLHKTVQQYIQLIWNNTLCKKMEANYLQNYSVDKKAPILIITAVAAILLYWSHISRYTNSYCIVNSRHISGSTGPRQWNMVVPNKVADTYHVYFTSGTLCVMHHP